MRKQVEDGMSFRSRQHGLYASMAAAAGFLLLSSTWLPAADSRKEFHYTVGSAATVSIVNPQGNVTVKPAPGRQVTIVATSHSEKVEINSRQNGNRVEARTRNLQKANGEEARVDYEVTLPEDASLVIDSGQGDVRVNDLRGSVHVESETGSVTVRGVTGGVQVQSVNSAVQLGELKQGQVQVTSTGGAVTMESVTGPMVSVRSTTGAIRYSGSFDGGGTYSFTSHSGDIEVAMAPASSVELTARSVKGSVENDFPFQKIPHPGFALTEGKSMAGTSHSGASSVELRSFTGKIRVRKQ